MNREVGTQVEEPEKSSRVIPERKIGEIEQESEEKCLVGVVVVTF